MNFCVFLGWRYVSTAIRSSCLLLTVHKFSVAAADIRIGSFKTFSKWSKCWEAPLLNYPRQWWRHTPRRASQSEGKADTMVMRGFALIVEFHFWITIRSEMGRWALYSALWSVRLPISLPSLTSWALMHRGHAYVSLCHTIMINLCVEGWGRGLGERGGNDSEPLNDLGHRWLQWRLILVPGC